MVPLTLDGAAEVVATIDVVANPREAAVVADVYFRGTVDVCVAGTAEGIVDAAVAEIDEAVAEDVAFATAAVDVLGLYQGQALLLFRVAGIGALQVHRAGVEGIIGLASFVARLADNTFLATAEDLEGVAVVQVHRGAAPDLRFCTITGTEHRHGYGLHVIALRLDEHTRTAVAAAFDFIRVAGICLGKQHFALMQVLIDVDDDVAVHVAAVVAAAIDVAAVQATFQVVGSFSCSSPDEVVLVNIPFDRVPLQLLADSGQLIVGVGFRGRLFTISNELAGAQGGLVIGLASRQRAGGDGGEDIIPALGLNDDVVQVDLQAVLDLAAFHVAVLLLGAAQDATHVSCVVGAFFHIGVVTAAHQLLEDDQTAVEAQRVLAGDDHATHITAAVERADLTGVVYVGFLVVRLLVEDDAGAQTHGSAVHVHLKGGGVLQIHGVVTVRGVSQKIAGVNHLLTVVAQEGFVSEYVGADLQFHQRVLLGRLQRSTVTAAEDGTADDGGLGFGALQVDGDLLGIGTEVVHAHVFVIQVAIDIITDEVGVVGVGVGAVAAAIDITADAGVNTDGIAAIHTSCHVVTAIDGVDVAAANEDAG